MNTFASLPTDVLYKFLALTGIFLIFGVPILFFQLRSKIFTNILEVSKALHELQLELIVLKKRQNEAKKLQHNLECFMDEYNLLEQKVNAINNEHLELQRINSFLKGNFKLLIIFLLGLLLSCTGFYFWYHKHQKLNEKFLELKIEELDQRLEVIRKGKTSNVQAVSKDSNYVCPQLIKSRDICDKNIKGIEK